MLNLHTLHQNALANVINTQARLKEIAEMHADIAHAAQIAEDKLIKANALLGRLHQRQANKQISLNDTK